jgi:hypothetical protein
LICLKAVAKQLQCLPQKVAVNVNICLRGCQGARRQTGWQPGFRRARTK